MSIAVPGALSGKSVPPWIKWLGMLLVVAVIVGGIYAYGQQQFGLGRKAERAEWLARENAELGRANAEIARLTLEKQAAEKAHQERLAAAATQFEKERGREKRKTDAVIADLRAGNAGLFYRADSRESADTCGTGQVVAATGGGDGGATTRLPGAVAEFLYSEADRADGIVRQLKLCQQVVVEDRRVCGQ